MAVTRKLSTVLLAALVALGGCSWKPKDAALVESGKQFMAKKDHARAALQFRSAIQANPRNIEAQYQLALAEMALGDRITAYRALTKTLDLNPKHMDAQLKMAELLLTSSAPEDVRQAEEHAQAVLDASPDNPDALDAMALAELKLGKPDDATELLEQASNKAPEHLQTAAMLATARLRQNDSAGAEQVLKQAVEKAPESLDARVVLGAFYLVIGKTQEAEQELRKVLAKDPNRPLALLDLAAMLNSQGRKNEAEELYRRLANRTPSPYQPLYGRYLFRIGKEKEAVAEFERLAKADPKDVNARTRLVAAYVATKRLADAQGVLKSALNKNPKDTAALLQRSEMNIMAGAYEDARKDLSQILHYTPDSTKAHFLLSGVERAEGKPLSQRQELSETLRLDPRFFGARIALAQSYIVDRQAHTALDLMNQSPPDQQDTLGFITYRNWALLASGDLKELRKGINQGLAKARTRDLTLQSALLDLQQKNYSVARSSLLEILKNNPEDLGAITVLIRVYAAQNQLPAAVHEIRALLSKRPNSAQLQYQLGALLAATGQPKDARTAFAAAVADGPEYAPARLALAGMDQAEGKPDAARQELNPLLASKTGEPPARNELGFIEAKAGNYAKAIEHLRKVVEAQPQNVIALNNLAYLLADHTNETDEALKFAQKAKELAPDDINVAGTIGWAYFRKGMYGFALQNLQDAVNREGKNVIDGTAIRRYHLAMAYKRVGDDDKAAKTLRAALQLDPNLPEARVATQMLSQSK
jgi:tetratricopeptide (TPR) repeat protein